MYGLGKTHALLSSYDTRDLRSTVHRTPPSSSTRTSKNESLSASLHVAARLISTPHLLLQRRLSPVSQLVPRCVAYLDAQHSSRGFTRPLDSTQDVHPALRDPSLPVVSCTSIPIPSSRPVYIPHSHSWYWQSLNARAEPPYDSVQVWGLGFLTRRWSTRSRGTQHPLSRLSSPL